jgi:tRNA-specific 2-thiouridylase
LVTADKPDSQDVCFVRDRDKDGFLRRQLQSGSPSALPRDAGLRGLLDPGEIVDTQGKVVGTHQGLLGFTIGQREGLGIAFGVPMYVVGMDRPANRLIVGPKEALFAGACRVNRLNWVSIEPPQGPVRAQVKIRSHHAPAGAVITPQPDGLCTVAFEQPQQAITPGQAAVFYDGDIVLGGGWIAN